MMKSHILGLLSVALISSDDQSLKKNAYQWYLHIEIVFFLLLGSKDRLCYMDVRDRVIIIFQYLGEQVDFAFSLCPELLHLDMN